MGLPEIVIDLNKIRQNTETILALARSFRIDVVGVTKVFLAEPRIAGAMLAGGVRMLADSRLENLSKLKQAFPDVPLMLLRLPGVSQVEETVRLAEVSLNSETRVLEALSAEGRRQGRVHGVIIMVDLGDLREGVWPEDLPDFIAKVLPLAGIKLQGLGVNLACYGGVVPTEENLGRLVELAENLEKKFGISLPVISGGNSASLPLLLEKRMPAQVNQLRVGEGIVLGRETVKRQIIPGAFGDAFTLRAEILEAHEKPSVPIGEVGQDAFGRVPEFVDEGWRRRGILALGRQDVPTESLSPRDGRLKIIGASSDHLIMDLSEAPELDIGSVLEFDLSYGGLLGAMTSPYVHKRYI
ncbi:hypothetical protein CEB3_c38940 [Peptococcaceae bacterium CEB3]|nr:hypothetical protein CEB3_c38940 [Peptococcaceae bacterium CEB3]